LGVQPQPGGNAGKTVAAHGMGRRERRADALGEQAPSGRAAGEVQRVDLARRQAGLRHRLAPRGDDALDVGLQRGLRLRVAHRIVVDEEHRAAEHGPARRHAGLGLGARLQVLQIAGDDVRGTSRRARRRRRWSE
jgi:hypothetical protein